MALCPAYRGSICSLDARCHDACKPGASLREQTHAALAKLLPKPLASRLDSRLGPLSAPADHRHQRDQRCAGADPDVGMHLMRPIGPSGVYGDPVLPDFMVFLNWRELPWFRARRSTRSKR